jgi:hypothetical protein
MQLRYSFKDKLDDNDIKIRFVPESCTGELQPLNVAGNDEFKRKIQNFFINWYSDELSKGMKLGNIFCILLHGLFITPMIFRMSYIPTFRKFVIRVAQVRFTLTY